MTASRHREKAQEIVTIETDDYASSVRVFGRHVATFAIPDRARQLRDELADKLTAALAEVERETREEFAALLVRATQEDHDPILALVNAFPALLRRSRDGVVALPWFSSGRAGMWRCELIRRDPDHWRIWCERYPYDHDGQPITVEELCRALASLTPTPPPARTEIDE